MPERKAVDGVDLTATANAPADATPAQHTPGTGYRPFLYTRQGKRSGQAYLLHHVLLEDVLVLAIAVCWTMPRPLVGAAGLLVLHLSFWLVYEIGYWENDAFAVRKEAAPTIPVGTATVAHRMKPVQAYLCALVLALPGGVLLVAGAGPVLRSWTGANGTGQAQVLTLLAGWVLYLMASRGAFWLYNRLSPESRVLPYAVLQLFRTLGYAVFLEMSLVGAIALLAVVLVRWMPYQAYRSTGVQPDVSHRLLLLFVFLVLMSAAVAVAPTRTLGSLQAGVVLLLFGVRAHRPLRALVRRVAADLRS